MKERTQRREGREKKISAVRFEGRYRRNLRDERKNETRVMGRDSLFDSGGKKLVLRPVTKKTPTTGRITILTAVMACEKAKKHSCQRR